MWTFEWDGFGPETRDQQVSEWKESFPALVQLRHILYNIITLLRKGVIAEQQPKRRRNVGFAAETVASVVCGLVDCSVS